MVRPKLDYASGIHISKDTSRHSSKYNVEPPDMCTTIKCIPHIHLLVSQQWWKALAGIVSKIDGTLLDWVFCTRCSMDQWTLTPPPTYNKGTVRHEAAKDSSRKELTVRSTITRFSLVQFWNGTIWQETSLLLLPWFRASLTNRLALSWSMSSKTKIRLYIVLSCFLSTLLGLCCFYRS